MQTLFFLSLVLGLILPIALYLLGRDHVLGALAKRTEIDAPLEAEHLSVVPSVGMVVPVTGNTPDMKACLESLLGQTYPNYQVVFVTGSMDDPAVQVINQAIPAGRNARHIVSGAASRCSQKNHNLLAGIEALGPSVEILIFCDSTHWAPTHFLTDLIGPLIRGEAVMATGFRRIVPADFRLPTLGMLVSVMTIHFLQAIQAVSQPWGGATAIRRKTFEDHKIGSLWAENVVDDVSMGVCLATAGIRVKPVSTACLLSRDGRYTLQSWRDWLMRQLFYLKFCQPGTWVAMALAAYILAAPLMSILACITGVMGIVPGTAAIAGIAHLTVFTAIGLKWRSLTPEKISPIKWIAAVFAANMMFVFCYVGTWFSNIVQWRGISYLVSRNGRVKKVIRKV